MKSLITASVSALALIIAPVSALAATVVGGVNSGGGWFFGVGSGGGFGGLGCGSSTICDVASTFLYLINYVLVPLLFAVAFIMFIYGVAKAYIFSGGEADAVSDGHRLVLWGVIGFVVMISLWGLVNVVANTFGLAGYGAPPLPSSTY